MAKAADPFEKATFAGGCFWCIESAFEGTEGVISAISGYTGGSEKTASYEQVAPDPGDPTKRHRTRL